MIDWPLDSNYIRRGKLNHTFGMVRKNVDGSTRPHQGWDFFAPESTPCYAVADGKVTLLRTVGDYGNTIVLEILADHDGDGDLSKVFVAYSHLSKIEVKVGETVKRGQRVGLTGNSGNALSMRGADCHLHFEARFISAPGRGLTGRFSPMQLFRHCPLDAPIKRRGS